MILARLLTPEDYGVVAMVTSITGFLTVFRDAGLSSATIQREGLDHKQASALFWINTAVGVLLAAICFASGPVIAAFYGDERLIAVTAVSALVFIFGGLAAQHQALLFRSMRFRVRAAIEIASLAIGIGLSVLLAWTGAGYMALAWMPVIVAAVHTLGIALTVRWRPSLQITNSNIGDLVKFGAYLTGFNTINYFARNLDNILIGKVWGPMSLGFYSRAYGLMTLPIKQINEPIGTVVFPVLSRLQSDPARFRRYYLNALFLLTALTTPLCLTLAVLAPEIVLIVLGPRWEGAIPIFRLLAISAVLQPILNTSGWLYTATGNSKRLFKWGSLGSLWLIGSFFIGLPFGPEGVAAAYALACAAWAYPCMRLAVANTAINVRDIVEAVRDPFLACLPGLIWIVAARHLLSEDFPLWVWLFVGLAGMVGLYWLLLSRAFGRGPFFRGIRQQLSSGF